MSPDLEILAKTLYGEAEAHDEGDALAIAHVIMNRVALPNWPSSIAEVCLQPYQFSCWNVDNPRRGEIAGLKRGTNDWYNRLIEIARSVINGETTDPTGRATHYYASYIKEPRWAKGHTPSYVETGGQYSHRFYNDIDTPPPQDAVDALAQERPITSTRTMQGVKGGAGGLALSGVTEAIQEAADGVQTLVPYLETMKWAFIGLSILSLCMIAWARIDDRRKGKR